MALLWNALGLLPPIAPEDLVGSNRSPYMLTLSEVAEIFVTTETRLGVFRGLVRYRKALYDIGICKGFQWLNGSFVEQVEIMRKRPPNDTDVVNFVYLPQGCKNQQDLFEKNPDLFAQAKVKVDFQVDGYWVFLGGPMTEQAVRQVSYWYGLWSHQRGSLAWKGFVQLALSPNADGSIDDILKMKEGELRHES